MALRSFIVVLVLGPAIAAAHPGRPIARAANAARAAAVKAPDGVVTAAARHRAAKPTEVAPLPGWPKWAGELNHQISGLAYRDGRLFAVSDQSGAWKRAILEIDLDAASAKRILPVKVVCRWSGGPHPDTESLVVDPLSGPPRTYLMTLEAEADAVIEVGAGTCEYLGSNGPLTGSVDNEGIEGIALSPDGRTLYLTDESRHTLMTMPRGEPGPARVIAKIKDADSLCDAAYDDRGTAATEDDRLLLLDRNGRQIFAATTAGEVLGRWILVKKDAQIDPDGFAYSLVSFEGLAIESREEDGATIVYLSTDTPPRLFPYHRKDREDPDGRYSKRVGMLYKYRLPPLGPAAVPSAEPAPPSGDGATAKGGG